MLVVHSAWCPFAADTITTSTGSRIGRWVYLICIESAIRPGNINSHSTRRTTMTSCAHGTNSWPRNGSNFYPVSGGYKRKSLGAVASLSRERRCFTSPLIQPRPTISKNPNIVRCPRLPRKRTSPKNSLAFQPLSNLRTPYFLVLAWG